MPLQPVSRRVLIKKLKALGFGDPKPGGNHPFMPRGKLKLHIPNEHTETVSRDLLARILRQGGISHDDWKDA